MEQRQLSQQWRIQISISRRLKKKMWKMIRDDIALTRSHNRNEINQIVEPWVTFLHPFFLKKYKQSKRNFLIKDISSTPHGTCWTHAKNSANLNNLKAIVNVNYDVQIYQTNRTGNSSSLHCTAQLTYRQICSFIYFHYLHQHHLY